MGLLSGIFSPIRRLLGVGEDTCAPIAHASHLFRRQWVEPLEERQLLSSNGTFGGLTFNSNGTTDFANLFAHTNSVNSVTYTGSITGSGQTVSGTFSIAYVSSSNFSVTATGMSESQGGGVVTESNGAASLTLTGSGLTGTFSSVNVAVASTIPYKTIDPSTGNPTTNNDPITLSAGTSYSFTWDTTSGHDNNPRIGVNGATLTVLPSQSLIGNFVFEQQDGSTDQIAVSSISVSLSGGLVSLTNGAGTLHMTSNKITGSNNGVSAGNIGASSSGTSFTATGSSVIGFSINTGNSRSEFPDHWDQSQHQRQQLPVHRRRRVRAGFAQPRRRRRAGRFIGV